MSGPSTLPTTDAAASTTALPVVNAEAITPRADRDAVIIRIAEAAGIHRNRATKHLNWLDNLTARCRNNGGHALLSSQDITYHHDVFRLMIPARTTAEPGSLQDDVESVVLDRAAGELGLWHDIDLDMGVRHCSVTLTTVDVR